MGEPGPGGPNLPETGAREIERRSEEILSGMEAVVDSEPRGEETSLVFLDPRDTVANERNLTDQEEAARARNLAEQAVAEAPEITRRQEATRTGAALARESLGLGTSDESDLQRKARELAARSRAEDGRSIGPQPPFPGAANTVEEASEALDKLLRERGETPEEGDQE